MLQKPTDTAGPLKIADLLEALGQFTQIDGQYPGDDNHADRPCCPHCGRTRTTLLAEWPRPGVPQPPGSLT